MILTEQVNQSELPPSCDHISPVHIRSKAADHSSYRLLRFGG